MHVMTFQFRMILEFIRIMLFVLFLLCDFFEPAIANCTLSDGTIQSARSVWTNERGCKCKCVALEGMHFQQCRNCPSRVKTSAISKLITRDICKYNGFDYFVNETWMSVETECTECRCEAGGRLVCVSEKHCSNTCSEGQIPTYGLCCEVKGCLGQVSASHESIPCLDVKKNETVPHGRTAVMAEECVDKFCICYNGLWKCHNFCKILKKPLKKYNKLCCPRLTADQPCTFGNTTFLSGQNVNFNQINRNCTCLKGRVLCNENPSEFGTHLNLQRSAILYILVSAILLIICCICIVVIYNVLRVRKPKLYRKENYIKMKLLTDVSSEPPETPTPTDHICQNL